MCIIYTMIFICGHKGPESSETCRNFKAGNCCVTTEKTTYSMQPCAACMSGAGVKVGGGGGVETGALYGKSDSAQEGFQQQQQQGESSTGEFDYGAFAAATFNNPDVFDESMFDESMFNTTTLDAGVFNADMSTGLYNQQAFDQNEGGFVANTTYPALTLDDNNMLIDPLLHFQNTGQLAMPTVGLQAAQLAPEFTPAQQVQALGNDNLESFTFDPSQGSTAMNFDFSGDFDPSGFDKFFEYPDPETVL